MMNSMTSASRSAAVFATALVLLAGCHKKEEMSPPASGLPAAKPAIVSAEKNSFEQVTSKLDPGGNVYLYLSTEQTLSGLSNRLAAASNLVSVLPNIPGTGLQTLDNIFAVLGGLVQESGVSQISGLGMSSIAREPGFYFSKVVVHHYPGQNAGLIWSLFGQAAHPLRQLDLLPESTALAAGSDFDLPLAWTNIQRGANAMNLPGVKQALEQAPAKFRQLTGLDLDATLQSLGGEYNVILTLDQHKTITLPLPGNAMEIPSPGLVLVFKVKSDLIFDRVDQLTKGNMLVSKVDEPDLKMRTLALPIPLAVELRPSLARVGDYLMLASSDSLVREIVAVKSGQKKGYAATDEFKRLSQGIPGEGNNFNLVTGAFSATLGKSITNQANGPEILKAMRQFMPAATNSSSYSVGANNPDGWEAVANGSQSLQAMAAPAMVVAGIVAAIAIPKIAAAHATTTQQDVPKPGTEPAHLASATTAPPAQTSRGHEGISAP
jgi:hypothetical protein